MNRARWLGGALALALVALAAAGGDPLEPEPVLQPERGRGLGQVQAGADRWTPWSVQLHLHGPASEGPASVDSHSFEASRLGVDVLWWSEHDWRNASFHSSSTYGFEGPERIDQNEPWTARLPSELDDLDARGKATKQPRLNRKRIEKVRGTEFDTQRFVEGQGSFCATLEPVGSAQSPGRRVRGQVVGQAKLGEDGWQRLERVIRSPRARFTHPLASGVTLEVAVLPAHLDDGVRPVIRFELSEHPLREVEGELADPFSADPPSAEPSSADPLGGPARGRPTGSPDDFARWNLAYVLVAATDDGSLPEGVGPDWEGTTYRIPVPARAGEWNRLSLPLTADARDGFGELGPDNSLRQMWFGLEAQGERGSEVCFDALRITCEVAGPEAIARQIDVVETVARHYPELREFAGLEVSYVNPHLNVYGMPATEALPDYEALIASSGLLTPGPGELEGELEGQEAGTDMRVVDPDALGRHVAADLVARARAAGALVSFNHMFGTEMERATETFLLQVDQTKEAVLERLVEHRLFGAELMEVGYRDRGGHGLEEHLWVWDQLAEVGVLPVGTGVSDSHGGPEQRWAGGGNNFVSWIWARDAGLGPTEAALLEGLAAGRVYFGDIELFDGTVELTTARGFRMGQVVITDRDTAQVRGLVTGLGEKHGLHWVGPGLGVVDGLRAGGRAEHIAGVQLEGRETTFVRLEVRDKKGRPVVLSNPIHFRRDVPPGGLGAARAAVDLAGVRSGSMEGFRLLGARATESELGPELALELEATSSGSLELELDGTALRAAHPPRFEAAPDGELWGAWEPTPKGLLVSGLRGRGRVVIPLARD